MSVGWFVQVITFSCGPRHQRGTRYGEERGKIYVICPVAATRKVRGGYSAFPDTMLVGCAPGGFNTDSTKRNIGLQLVLFIRQPHNRLPKIQTAVKTIIHDITRKIKIPITKPAIQYILQPVPAIP